MNLLKLLFSCHRRTCAQQIKLSGWRLCRQLNVTRFADYSSPFLHHQLEVGSCKKHFEVSRHERHVALIIDACLMQWVKWWKSCWMYTPEIRKPVLIITCLATSCSAGHQRRIRLLERRLCAHSYNNNELLHNSFSSNSTTNISPFKNEAIWDNKVQVILLLAD
jgi:hypothetical protein